MVGIIQSNWTGADIKATFDGMTKCMYKTAVWQHNTLPTLCCPIAAWGDNDVVKILSNSHLLDGGHQ